MWTKRGSTWTSQLWAGQQSSANAATTDSSPETIRASFLFSRARILTRVADKAVTPDAVLYEEAFQSLKETHSFAVEHRDQLRGDVEIYLADVAWWLGRTAVNLGKYVEATKLLKMARSQAAMAHPRFAAEVGVRAWVMEAESLALLGRISEARQTIGDLINHPAVPSDAKDRARVFQRFVEQTIVAVIQWFKAPEAIEISRICAQKVFDTLFPSSFRRLYHGGPIGTKIRVDRSRSYLTFGGEEAFP